MLKSQDFMTFDRLITCWLAGLAGLACFFASLRAMQELESTEEKLEHLNSDTVPVTWQGLQLQGSNATGIRRGA